MGLVVMSRHPYIAASLALLALSGLLIVTGCYPSHPLSTFDPHGPVAQRQMDLFVLLFWVCLVIFVVVGGATLYALIRYRRRAGDGIPEQVHGNTRLEIGWTIAPVILLAIIAVPTIIAQFYVSNAPEDALEINVTAYQWWWAIEYPDSGVITANELHVPVGKAVKINLTSKDVLHSFWVPKLAGKIDAFPGKTNELWFRADDVGEYYGQCAEFCGESHAWMRFRVIADTQDDYEAWVSAQLEPGTAVGNEVFMNKGCIACHTISGVPGAVGLRGPDLTHFASRSAMAAGIMDRNEENLREWLSDPEEVKPGNIMAREAPVYTNPELALSASDIDSLVAYLQSLE